MENESYYVRNRGRISGPFDLETLRDMQRRGALSPVHELSADQVTWRPAREYQSILRPLPSTTSAASASTNEPVPAAASGLSEAADQAGTITFDCPKCGAHIAAPVQYAGRAGQCRSCGAKVVIPSPRETEPSEGPPEFKKCPACAEMIRAEAKKCRHCGERFDQPEAPIDESAGWRGSHPSQEQEGALVPYRLSEELPLASGRRNTLSRVCPMCRMVSPASAAICTNCGYDYRTGGNVGEAASATSNSHAPAPYMAQSNVHIQSSNAGFQSLMMFQIQKKSLFLAYVFWFFFGGLGGHRFYADKKETGLAMLLGQVLGWVLVFSGHEQAAQIGAIVVLGVGVWALIDVFLIPSMIREYNLRLAANLRT